MRYIIVTEKQLENMKNASNAKYDDIYETIQVSNPKYSFLKDTYDNTKVSYKDKEFYTLQIKNGMEEYKINKKEKMTFVEAYNYCIDRYKNIVNKIQYGCYMYIYIPFDVLDYFFKEELDSKLDLSHFNIFFGTSNSIKNLSYGNFMLEQTHDFNFEIDNFKVKNLNLFNEYNIQTYIYKCINDYSSEAFRNEMITKYAKDLINLSSLRTAVDFSCLVSLLKEKELEDLLKYMYDNKSLKTNKNYRINLGREFSYNKKFVKDFLKKYPKYKLKAEKTFCENIGNNSNYVAENYNRLKNKIDIDIYSLLKYRSYNIDIYNMYKNFKIKNVDLIYAIENIWYDGASKNTIDLLLYTISKIPKSSLNKNACYIVARLIIEKINNFKWYSGNDKHNYDYDKMKLITDEIVKIIANTKRNNRAFILKVKFIRVYCAKNNFTKALYDSVIQTDNKKMLRTISKMGIKGEF